jgi:hypothetical protein
MGTEDISQKAQAVDMSMSVHQLSGAFLAVQLINAASLNAASLNAECRRVG